MTNEPKECSKELVNDIPTREDVYDEYSRQYRMAVDLPDVDGNYEPIPLMEI